MVTPHTLIFNMARWGHSRETSKQRKVIKKERTRAKQPHLVSSMILWVVLIYNPSGIFCTCFDFLIHLSPSSFCIRNFTPFPHLQKGLLEQGKGITFSKEINCIWPLCCCSLIIMGKTGRWIKHLFAGKKDVKSQACNGNDHPPGKERRRWSFRGSVGSRPERGSMDHAAASGDCGAENDAKKHALAVADLAVATAAAADAAVAAAKAAAAVIQLTTAAASGQGYGMDVAEAAAIRIQSVFRAHLARKALNALRGLVKLQALVRGHLVRKQATATLRCMQALITVQARARAQRLQMAAANETKELDKKKHHNGKLTLVNHIRNSNNDCEKSLEEKIVEMDLGCSKPTARARNSYSNHTQTQRVDQRIPAHRTSGKQENQQVSPAPSAMAEMSPRACSNHFEDYSFGTVQSSPQCYSAMSKPDLSKMPFSYARSEYGEPLYYDFAFYPNYMSNTESSRAKVRSHSAPKCRPADAFDRQPSRRRPSMEGRSLPKAVKMQRSSSQVSSNTQNYQLPCSVKLEKSTASECGSTATYRSIVGFEVQGARI